MGLDDSGKLVADRSEKLDCSIEKMTEVVSELKKMGFKETESGGLCLTIMDPRLKEILGK